MSGRKFTELNAGTVGANSIFAQAQAPATPGDPYTSTKVSATDVGNFVNGTQAYADIGNVTPLAAIAALQQGGASTANANIADEYDSSHTYNAGNRVIYEGVLYVCNDDNVTGAWDSTKWDSATIDEIISALTAADIPYSAGVSVADKLDNVPTFDTLTTSDNNKLLGSFIENNEVVVKAVGIETITLTPQTGITVGGSVKCKKFGNIAVVSIQNVTFANTGVNQLLITGAPKALETVYSSKPAGSNLNNTNNIAPNVAYVDNNGNIYFNIHASNATQHWISLVYPCEQ